MAIRILFTRDMGQRAFGVLPSDCSEGSKRVKKVHGMDLRGKVTKIARVKGHGNLNIEFGVL